MQRHLMYPAFLAILIFHKTPDAKFPFNQHGISTAMIDPIDRVTLARTPPHINAVRPHGSIAWQRELRLRSDIVGHGRLSWLRRFRCSGCRGGSSGFVLGSSFMPGRCLVSTGLACRMSVRFSMMMGMMGFMSVIPFRCAPMGGHGCKKGHCHDRQHPLHKPHMGKGNRYSHPLIPAKG